VLLLLAHPSDHAAAALVSRWRDYDARVMVPHDLSTAGWGQSFGAGNAAQAVVGGEVVPVSSISAVLTRLPYISAQELVHVQETDREYVATEMSAFLVAWLTRLSCRVLPRPRPPSIAGLGWRPEQWLRAAALLGIPIAPMRRWVTPAQGIQRTTAPVAATVTIVGARAIGDVDPVLTQHARRLSSVAGSELLAVHFTSADAGASLVGADEWPDLSAPDVADALLETLIGVKR